MMAEKAPRLAGLAEEGSRYFERALESKLYKVGAEKLVVTRFHDDIHDIILYLLLKNDGEILEAEADMKRTPYDICRRALVHLGEIRGIQILSKGALKKIRSKIPRELGCTHLDEAFEAAIRTFFSGTSEAYGRNMLKENNGIEYYERKMGIESPFTSRACIAFNPEFFDVEPPDKE